MGRKYWKTLVFGVVVATQLGCGHEVDPFEKGSLEVAWEVAPMGCEAGDVHHVNAVLQNERRSYDRRVGCNTSSMVFTNVEPGNYKLDLTGLDQGGHPTFERQLEDILIRPEERNDLGLVDLTARMSTAQVEWYFENQRVCGTNGVEEVELTVFDDAYYEVFRGSADCDAGVIDVEGLRAGQYLFRGRAFAGKTRFEGVSEHELKRGGEAQVEVSLINISN